MAPSQSLLPLLFLVSSFTPSLCPHLSKHFIPGCKAGAASALQGKASPFPSTRMSGTEAASPTQSLVSLPKGPRQIQFEAASRHMLCAMFYLCLAPRALEETWLGSPSAAKVQPARRPDSSSSLVNPYQITIYTLLESGYLF